MEITSEEDKKKPKIIKRVVKYPPYLSCRLIAQDLQSCLEQMLKDFSIKPLETIKVEISFLAETNNATP